MELSIERLSELKDAAGAMSAKMRAVRIVSASSVSKSDLERRLVQKGENPRQAHDAVNWMAQLDLVDDRKTAYQVVQRCIGKGYGSIRAKQALYEKRIPKQYWDEALEGYPDQMDYILTYLRGHLCGGSDEKAVRKAVDALIRRGHSFGTIKAALAEINMEMDEFPED
jgi:regulatory protein